MSKSLFQLSVGELLAIVASEASEHPFVGSERQKEAWDEIKRRVPEQTKRREIARRMFRQFWRQIMWGWRMRRGGVSPSGKARP